MNESMWSGLIRQAEGNSVLLKEGKINTLHGRTYSMETHTQKKIAVVVKGCDVMLQIASTLA